MLHFSNKPDAFFHQLILDALDHPLRTYLHGDNPELDAAGQEASVQVQAMKSALMEPVLYQLTEYHWFLLYEALYYHSYCCNELPLENRLYMEHEISQVDFDAVVELFFSDTDFLGHPTRGLTAAQRHMMADPLERWALGVGVRPPHPDKLTLTVCPEPWRHGFEMADVIDYASPETGEYPAVPDAESDDDEDESGEGDALASG